MLTDCLWLQLSSFHHLVQKHAETILGTPITEINQTVIGGGAKCKDSCMPLCDSTCQWAVTMAGPTDSPAAQPLSFLCNDDHASAAVSFGKPTKKAYTLAARSCKVIDSSTGVELWDSHSPAGADTPTPYLPIPSLAPGTLKWETWPSTNNHSKHT